MNNLVAVLQERLADLIAETKRLQEENSFLLEENKRLREELTVIQLRTDLGRIGETEAKELQSSLFKEALAFFKKLPEQMTFADFFRIADIEGLADDRARSFLRLYLRERLLQQQGSRMHKKSGNLQLTN